MTKPNSNTANLNTPSAATPAATPSNFIKHIIDGDLNSGKVKGVVTRFPPEPNGFLHIGHSKALSVNFGLAKEYGGRCHLRFDDTNPETEDVSYIESIMEDIRWLGYDWAEHLYYASDYYEKLYNFAIQLIEKDLAFVDDCSVEEIRRLRGSLTEPGQNSPFRGRGVKENLDLFKRMRAGEFADGSCVLRAKIDMTSPNMNMRDPLIYRIKKMPHPKTGDAWCIYPMYDFAHGLSDMIEGITHSICTLEFEDHRPLYDWFLEVLNTPCRPQQIEFARLNIDYTVMSKRRVLELVEKNKVTGWDDPRMFTLKGLRRRGYRPEGLKLFNERIGVTKANSVISFSVLEQAVRDDLDANAERLMAVLDPIKVTITNWPDNQTEDLSGPRHPKKPELGERKIPMTKTIYIDRDDFNENPPPGFHRLSPGGSARLRYSYVIHCDEVIKDPQGRVLEVRCTYDPGTKGGVTPPGQKKVKGIIHWVSATKALPCEVRIYEKLFTVSNPGKDFLDHLNPDSLKTVTNAWVEASALGTLPERHFQFERLGYFCTDMKDSRPEKLVFNKTVALKDGFAGG
jgi:glutaminyl-tRNA synthetase